MRSHFSLTQHHIIIFNPNVMIRNNDIIKSNIIVIIIFILIIYILIFISNFNNSII